MISGNGYPWKRFITSLEPDLFSPPLSGKPWVTSPQLPTVNCPTTTSSLNRVSSGLLLRTLSALHPPPNRALASGPSSVTLHLIHSNPTLGLLAGLLHPCSTSGLCFCCPSSRDCLQPDSLKVYALISFKTWLKCHHLREAFSDHCPIPLYPSFPLCPPS